MTLEERVARFEQWHYEFDLGRVRTPIFDPRHRNRHAQRRRYFFEPLLSLFGGTLAGKRVLDLGCNAGYWSLLAVEAGAAFVLGVDGRQMHVEQAELVFEAREIRRGTFRFIEGDVFDVDLGDEPFDIVLCLGLLYHVRDPFGLFERVSRWNSDVLVVDTSLSPRAGSAFDIAAESPADPRNSLDAQLVLLPTRQAVVDLARGNGYRAAVIKPAFTSYRGCFDYRVGLRRAFICSKATSLDGLTAEIESRPSRFAGVATTWARRAGRAIAARGRHYPV